VTKNGSHQENNEITNIYLNWKRGNKLLNSIQVHVGCQCQIKNNNNTCSRLSYVLKLEISDAQNGILVLSFVVVYKRIQNF